MTNVEPDLDNRGKTHGGPKTSKPASNGPVDHSPPADASAPKARKARKPIPENETKRGKFKRVASHRTNEILHRLDILITMGRNRTSYEYDNKDVERIILAIRSKVDILEATIRLPDVHKEKFEV